MFLYSDVYSAAEEFVEAISEHSDPLWEQHDIEALTKQLTDRALNVLAEPEATF
jgi:hypothetical protein